MAEIRFGGKHMGAYKHEVNIELAPVPMKPATLIHIVMPALVRVAVGKEGYFTIGYSPIRGDRISAIQAASSGKELHVEVVFGEKSRGDFRILAKDPMSVEKAIEMFYNVCVDWACPDVSGWEDITDKVKYIPTYSEKDMKCPVCRKFTFPSFNSMEICPICGWQDNWLQKKNPKYKGGANGYSLNDARKRYKEIENKALAVDKSTLDFMKAMLFGSYSDSFSAAALRAYRDFSRTLHMGGMSERDREQLRIRATDQLRTCVDMLKRTKPHNQQAFDVWHERTCYDIRGIYVSSHIPFTFGQAQKWVNMTLKYLYVLGEQGFDDFLDYLHVPIDDPIFTVARRELGISRPEKTWSSWDDYTNEYMKYQLELRKRLSGCSLFQWEMASWSAETGKN